MKIKKEFRLKDLDWTGMEPVVVDYRDQIDELKARITALQGHLATHKVELSECHSMLRSISDKEVEFDGGTRPRDWWIGLAIVKKVVSFMEERKISRAWPRVPRKALSYET